MHTPCTVAGVVALLIAAMGVAGCGDRNTPSNVQAPGAPVTARTEVLDKGAAVLQGKPPLAALNAYLDGFHFYSGHLDQQMEAHHYCANVNEDLIQCVIFDGNGSDAKLMGVEYIVSAALFATLPPAEKPLWHSHAHEVKSGTLVAPGIPVPAEHALMQKLVGTYGKTWHTWHTDRQMALPLGVPQLMMGFTREGQLHPDLVAARDGRMGVDTAANKARRADLPPPQVDPAANGWEHGQTLQINDPTGAVHGASGASSPR